MSLTSEISKEGSAINQYFKDNFNKLPSFLHDDNTQLNACASIVPSNMKDYPWKEVGHMVEYLICLSVGISVQRLMPMVYLAQSQGFSAKKLFSDICTSFNRSLNCDSVNFLEQCQYLFVLAQMEDSLRTTGKIDFKIEIPQVSTVVLSDMKNIFNTSIKNNELLMGRYVYNPTFELSASVGGADADLIKINTNKKNILIDIKTTKNACIAESWIYQLIGYTFLDKINYYKINDLAIYLPRQNVLLNWSVEDVILKGSVFSSVKEAKRAFVKALKIKAEKD